MEKNRYGIVYKIRNKINDKVYIGLSAQERGFDDRYCAKGEGIERVYNYYTYQEKNNQFVNVHLLNSIKKYGRDNFEVAKEIDVAYSKKELLDKEKYWIKHYDCTNIDKGYNRTEGGDSFLNGEDHPRYNQVEVTCDHCGTIFKNIPSRIKKSTNTYCSRECADKGLGLLQRGENNPQYNRTTINCCYCNEEIVRPPSLINKLNYCSRECKSNHQKTINVGSENPRARKVICITTKKVFSAVTEASEYYKCSRQHISKSCQDETRYCGVLEDGTKLKWKYYDEYQKERLIP